MASRSTELSEDEAMAGGIVWLCENGHVDVAHKTEGNHLNLCSRCKEGACEPRRTLGRRSKAQRQRDRDLGVYEPRRGRSTPLTTAPSSVTITKPGEESIVVDAELLQAPQVLGAWSLSREERQAILAGKPPRLSFPRNAPAGHPEDQPWPAAIGDVVEVTSNVSIAVTAQRTLVGEIVVEYEVFDSRSRSDVSPISTIKPRDTPKDRMGGPEIRAEREPEWLPKREVSKLANRVHEAELQKLRRTREDLGRNLQEQAAAPRDVRFHIRKSIEAIDRRIENIERDMAA